MSDFLAATELEAEMAKEPKLREVFEDRTRRIQNHPDWDELIIDGKPVKGALNHFEAELMAFPPENPKRVAAHFLCLLYQVRTEEVDRELPHQLVRGEARVAPWRRRDSNDNAANELRILKAAASRLDIPSILISEEMDAAARLSFESQKEVLRQLPEAVKAAHAWAVARHAQSLVVMPINGNGLKEFNDALERCEKSLSQFVKTVATVGGSLAAGRIHAEYVEAIQRRESAVFEVNRCIFAPTITISEDDGVLYRQVGYRAAPVRIGTTFGDPKDNRLRKFVQRQGQLVEVRTRGRTGHRSLQEAVKAALESKKLSGFNIGRILIDDAVTKETP